MPRKAKPKEAAELIRKIVTETGTTSQTASMIGTSAAYLNHLATGYRTPSPRLIETMSSALNLTAMQTTQLHQAAARDHGFKIDLKED